MGNDGNTGLSPAQAWLTIDNAANNVAAGDTVYIGAGIYPEVVTMDTSGTSGNIISFIGDIDGVQTGDPGPVVISAHDSVSGEAVRDEAMGFAEKEFLLWKRVIFDGGTYQAVGFWTDADDWACEEVTFEDCVFLGGNASDSEAMNGKIGTGATPTTAGLTCRRCVFVGTLAVQHENNAVAHENLKWTLENCLFIGRHDDDTDDGMYIYGISTNTYSIGGIDLVNSTFLCCRTAVWGERYLKNTTNLVRLLNCNIIGATTGAQETTCTANTISLAYCRLWATTTLSYGAVLDAGNNDRSISGPILGGIADLMFYNLLGWSPWKPWEPMNAVDGTVLTPFVSAGDDAATTPADDVYGNSRPMGRSAATTKVDTGHVEARARGQDETGTVRTGSHSMAIKGAGYHDMHLPVDAALTTVSVYARYDGNYTGNLPKLEVLEIPGVADQSDIQTGAAGAWEALSCAFTPTSAGYVRVRLLSQDTSADGECYFDDLAVT